MQPIRTYPTLLIKPITDLIVYLINRNYVIRNVNEVIVNKKVTQWQLVTDIAKERPNADLWPS